MGEGAPGDITEFLQRWTGGDESAVDELAPLVYDHLRSIAAAFLRRESPGHILQPTALVHETFLRLLQQQRLDFSSRQHFYAYAAKMMRRILVDGARVRKRVKRGSGIEPMVLSPELAWVDPCGPELIDLDRQLMELEKLDLQKARIIDLRVFLGCTSEETASILELSKATVDRQMRFSLAWLQDRLEQSEPAPGEARSRS